MTAVADTSQAGTRPAPSPAVLYEWRRLASVARWRVAERMGINLTKFQRIEEGQYTLPEAEIPPFAQKYCQAVLDLLHETGNPFRKALEDLS